MPQPKDWGIKIGKEKDFELSVPRPEYLAKSKQGYIGFALVAYRDIFGNSKRSCSAVLFSPTKSIYLSGPSVVSRCASLYRLKDDEEKSQKQPK